MNKSLEWVKISLAFTVILLLTHGITLGEGWELLVMAICGGLIGNALARLLHKPKNAIK